MKAARQQPGDKALQCWAGGSQSAAAAAALTGNSPPGRISRHTTSPRPAQRRPPPRPAPLPLLIVVTSYSFWSATDWQPRILGGLQQS